MGLIFIILRNGSDVVQIQEGKKAIELNLLETQHFRTFSCRNNEWWTWNDLYNTKNDYNMQ